MDRHRDSPVAERGVVVSESAGNHLAAMGTAAVPTQVIPVDLVPVTDNQGSPAPGAIGRPSFGIVDIACIDVSQSLPICDFP